MEKIGVLFVAHVFTIRPRSLNPWRMGSQDGRKWLGLINPHL